MKNKKITPFQRVINYFGNASQLAKALGISRSAVGQWQGRIPPSRVYQIESITGGSLTANDLLGNKARP